ncbi:hypothetical protein Thpro_022699 [Acidihalobacter prosperus]|uniref:PilZ domain-containing protein n=1 Tax=Acidihalobacter prosperus TaxID=160660 RepID=A0A1A6C1M4_9GAMM|nr:hypothetical protein Thpro_022699 [Acidihalobacter prosperus]
MVNTQQEVTQGQAMVEQPVSHELAAVLAGGTRVYVQIRPYEARFEASVLGCVADRYLIFRADGTRGGPPVPPRVGDNIVVRFLVEGVAYGFNSSIMHTISVPEPLIFMQYPATITRVSVRQHQRLPCRLPCVVTGDNGEKETALLLDISEQGAKVACRNPSAGQRSAGMAVGLELALPDPLGIQALIGKIVRITEQGKANVAGVVFDQPYPELLANLYTILCIDQFI